MKKLPLLFLLMVTALVTLSNPLFFDVDQKTLQSFRTLFPNAQSITWYEQPDSYTAHFVENGIRAKVEFLKTSQRIIYTRYYLPGQLPDNIKIQFNRAYPGATLTGVTEISGHSRQGRMFYIEYYVTAVQGSELLNLKVKRNGKISLLSKHTKAAQ